MSNVSEIMLSAVSTAKENVKRAEQEFNERSRAIRIMATSRVDLNNTKSLNRISEIASVSRDACDALYAAYQTQIMMVDGECRGLLEQSPSYRAVKAVTELIIKLNKDSEIENNYAASVNEKNCGTILKVKYHPSIESKMVESFWESKCYGWANRDEEEQKIAEEERAKAEAKARAAQEAMQAWGDRMQKSLSGKTRTEIAELFLMQHISNVLYDLDSGSIEDIIANSEELAGVSPVKVRHLVKNMVGTYLKKDGETNFIVNDDYELEELPPYNAPVGTAAALWEYEKNSRIEQRKQEEAAKERKALTGKAHRTAVERQVKAALDGFKTELTSCVKHAKDECPKLIEKKLEEIRQKKAALNEQKKSLGLFQMLEKKQVSKQLEEQDKLLSEYSSKDAKEKMYGRIEELASKAISDYEKKLSDYLAYRFPYETELKKAEEKILEKGSVEERILLAVYKNPECGIGTINEADPVLSQMTRMKLSSAVRLLVGTSLEREDANGIGIFTLYTKEPDKLVFGRYLPKGLSKYFEAPDYADVPIPEYGDIGAIFENI